jgi:hypothetical protein
VDEPPGVGGLFAEGRDARRELVGPRRGLAEPEGDRRRGTLGVGDAHGAAVDAEHPPGGVAELEDVPTARLDGEVLVDRAHEGALGLEQHLVVGGVGDRPAAGDGGQTAASAAAQTAVDPVAMEQPATSLGVKLHDGVEVIA